MSQRNSFIDFLRRVRAGDEGAAVELVRLYEPAIRREVRLRLTDPAVTRLVDSVDVCQSVLRSFFVRARAGQYDLDSPADLLRLLVRMARNKAINQARRVRARPADACREPGGPEALDSLAGSAPAPGAVLADRDLLAAVFERLTEEERRLAELRGEGCNWAEVSARLGGTPDARRKQLSRALDRVTRQLGIDDAVIG
ncbi:MAG TPA: sigma-70 family RNA polymerase sigma factor [Gemmataceae bacterium]|nr:sigma-70 family RNA polymerase sigma factor [Gemmataceae bacterium]